MPTIKEVALRARVSVGTVSNVLSGRVPVSQRLSDRVHNVSRQVDYHPNHIARSLKIRQSNTIGFVISDITNPFFTQLVRGAEDAAWKANYLLIILNSDEQLEREGQVIAALRARRVDGVLLVSAGDGASDHIRALIEAGTPLVCVDREIPSADCVVVNNQDGARACVAHLISTGHRRIGMLNGDLRVAVARERHLGYQRALRDARISYDPALVTHFGPRVEDGFRGAAQILGAKSRPDAIFTCNSMLAMGLLRALRERGLACPRDIAIAAFDDSIFHEATVPPLTSVAQPAYELGKQSVELLLQRIAHPVKSSRRKPTRIVLDTALVIRESSGAAAMGAH
jgi:LacI family transcriptional regulator